MQIGKGGKVELTESNILEVLEELMPYIEADGGWLEYVETEDNYVKVRLGGACSTCAMSSMTLKHGIEKKLMMEIPDIKGVIQVL
jgi:Fe-S cluster biogenesis protein NfuA